MSLVGMHHSGGSSEYPQVGAMPNFVSTVQHDAYGRPIAADDENKNDGDDSMAEPDGRSSRSLYLDGDDISGQVPTSRQPAKRKPKENFPMKLFRVLNDPRYQDVCRWIPDGTGFSILDQGGFALTAMQAICQTPHFDAFIRQLNTYGFKKFGRPPRVARGSAAKLPLTFKHTEGHFVRYREELLALIQRNERSSASARMRGQAEPSTIPLTQDIGDEIVIDHGEPFDIRGHFCDVFLGKHRVHGRVALKRMRHRGADETMVRHFTREKDLWMGLKHDRILRCLGTFTKEQYLYLVSPYMQNGSLYDWLRSGSRIGLERLRLIRELADALVYLHSSGIVHGDVKSNNVLLSDDFNVQLCDFGLTKLSESSTTTTLKGAGTVRWQSPELWNEAHKSFKSDAYAFAMTIVEVLTGNIPFAETSSDIAVIMAVSLRDERPAQLPMVSPDGASYLRYWQIATRCWIKDPEQRMSMAEASELFDNNNPSMMYDALGVLIM